MGGFELINVLPWIILCVVPGHFGRTVCCLDVIVIFGENNIEIAKVTKPILGFQSSLENFVHVMQCVPSLHFCLLLIPICFQYYGL